MANAMPASVKRKRAECPELESSNDEASRIEAPNAGQEVESCDEGRGESGVELPSGAGGLSEAAVAARAGMFPSIKATCPGSAEEPSNVIDVTTSDGGAEESSESAFPEDTLNDLHADVDAACDRDISAVGPGAEETCDEDASDGDASLSQSWEFVQAQAAQQVPSAGTGDVRSESGGVATMPEDDSGVSFAGDEVEQPDENASDTSSSHWQEFTTAVDQMNRAADRTGNPRPAPLCLLGMCPAHATPLGSRGSSEGEA